MLYPMVLRKVYILLYNLFMARRAKKTNKSAKTQNLVPNNYFVHKIVAFFINLPNYNNLLNNITLNKLVKIFKIKKNPKEYVLLYMGVDTTALGLGAALAELIKIELCNKKCTSIGALIHKGKVTNNFYNELIDNKYHYVLLEINVSN